MGRGEPPGESLANSAGRAGNHGQGAEGGVLARSEGWNHACETTAPAPGIKPPRAAESGGCECGRRGINFHPVMRRVPFSCAFSSLRRFVPAGMAAIACMTPVRADPQLSTTGPVVQLPAFTVVETRLLPSPESWRYAQAPGFEILSNAPDGTTEGLVHNFLLFHQAVDAVWPAARMNAEVTASLVLCRSASRFAEFVPANMIHDAGHTLSLCLQDREDAAIVVNLEDPDSVELGGMSDFSRRLLHDEYVHFLVGRIGPRTPPWLENSLVKLFGAMLYDESQFGLPAIEDPDLAARKAFAAAQPASRSAGPPSPAPLSDNPAFIAAVKAGSFMPLGQLFAADSDGLDGADSPRARECYEFVHLCLFGSQMEYRTAFLNFAYLAAREPVTESLFRQCFKKGYDDMLAILWGYTDFAEVRGFKLQDSAGRPLPAVPALALREAADAESARVRGEAQRMAGRIDEARRSLIAPYVRGSRDPQLLAALGLAEHAAGRDERAGRFLEAAIAARTSRARAYVEFARLRYVDSLSKPAAAGGRLGIDQITSVLKPLFVARSLPPHLFDLYELIAQTWSHASVEPTAGNLGAVDEGVLLFPYDTDLVYADAQLQAHAGRKAPASALCEIGLQFAPDAGTRERFSRLKDSLLTQAPDNNAPR